MSIPLAICRQIGRINDAIGKTLCWLIGAMALLVTIIVILRFFFNQGAIAAQESVMYMHAIVFMLCLAFAAQAEAMFAWIFSTANLASRTKPGSMRWRRFVFVAVFNLCSGY